MSFNTDALTLLALGIRDDNPVDSDQPPLVDGIHLRWYPRQDLSFPWHGFYLFRRESRPRRLRCLSGAIGGLRPGPSRSASLTTRLGRIASQRPLVFTDDFQATGTVEFDLTSGLRFDLPAGVEAGSVEVRIGLRDPGLGIERKCVDFRRFPLGHGPSPRTEQEIVFETELPQVSPPILVTVIERWGDSVPGLNSSRRLQITLPREASRVDLLLTNRHAVRLEALNQEGGSVAVRELRPGELQAGVVSLAGAGIAQVILQGSAVDAALLHEICFETPSAGGGESRVGIRILAGEKVVGRTVVQGTAGQVVPASLSGDGITAIEIEPGPAALIDLCYLPTRQGVVHGWEEVPGFTYPLCLPVDHADYLCPGSPVSFDDAKALALSRVTYPGPPGWEDGFADLHGQLAVLVDKGPAGGPMADRKNPDLPGEPESPATQPELPKMPGLRPLDLILLASLHPTIAQMVGLYFVDRSAELGVGYDYLLLADPTGVLGGGAAGALDWLAFSADASKLDADIVFDRKAEPRPPIAPPGEGRAYVLPGPTTRMIDGNLPKSAGNVGLWWPLPADSTTEEQPDRIVFYYPKRASFGPAEPASPPADSAYQPLRNGAPFLVSEPDPPNPPVPPNPRSSDWPPPWIPLHLVDGHLAEGWYSYRLSGQDLFGRRSGLGPPARWYEWTPSAEHERHKFAVALLDKVPPPIPLGVEAWALDPPDRWVLADAPYTTWRDDHPDLVGLRVRWRWTYLQQLQAPDTREFRIYYQPGRWNALLGRIVKVVAASATESDVALDFADSNEPGKLTGARLRVGNDDFAILGSQPGAPLRLRVKNLGVHDEVRPSEGKPCTVAIPETHALWVDTSLAKTWAKRLAVVPYGKLTQTVFDPSKDRNGQPLTSTNVVFKTIQPIVTGADVYFPPVPVIPSTPDSPRNPDLSGLQPWIDHLWLQGTGNAKEAHPILRYDAAARTVTLKDAPTLAGSPVAWILGRPTREYEVFLEAPDVGKGNPFEPSLADPAVYAQIAVSAADDKAHTKDDPKWNDPDRYGNESRLSPSATVFRVLQKKPEPPELVEKFGRIFATPADYHSRSYFTFRFVPQEHLRVHILRALDESLFRRDWLIRETRTALDPVPDPPPPGTPIPDPPPPEVKREHLDYFPDGPPAWDFSKREAAAKKLNEINDEADYDALPPDAWEVLALLPGNEGASADAKTDDERKKALKKRDWLVRQARTNLAIAGPKAYALLPDDVLRDLAALPGNEAAFVQVTLAPLDMSDPVLHDERRPDDDALYVPGPARRRAYTDTLPGRATNRYFYRALYVDGAQNQSALSRPTLPVYLPKVEPPRAPVITKVIGGDRQITIEWASNRERNLVEYRVYRAETEDATLDLRTMTQIHSEPVAVGDPMARPSSVSWTDAPVPGLVIRYYAIAVTDDAGNVSEGSAIGAGRAFDQATPEIPTLIAAWTSAAPPTQARLNWSSSDETRLEHRTSDDGFWAPIGPWRPPGVYDEVVILDPTRSWVFRLRVRRSTGAVAVSVAIPLNHL
ncbi:MAG TPA: hypothetical protein VF756_24930 [Thermoanaerobaculia bacterium]